MSDKTYVVDAYIEIPLGSRNKYEYDPGHNCIRLDRVLYASVVYPTQYGFIPDTLAPDGDPLDIMVLASQPVFPGCRVRARVLGALQMNDSGEQDHKILAVTDCDPRLQSIRRLEDVAPEVRNEIENFFRTYKDLEGHVVDIVGWEGQEAAEEAIEQCRTSTASS